MKLWILGLCLFCLAIAAFAVGDKAASGWSVTNVGVSTTNVTAIPATALTGRYKMIIQNGNAAFNLYIGTSTSLTFSNAFAVVKNSTTIELPLSQNVSVFGLGEPNASTGTIDVRIIEFK